MPCVECDKELGVLEAHYMNNRLWTPPPPGEDPRPPFFGPYCIGCSELAQQVELAAEILKREEKG